MNKKGFPIMESLFSLEDIKRNDQSWHRIARWSWVIDQLRHIIA